MGNVIGLNLAAGIKAATEPDPNDPSKKKSFNDAYGEVRLNMTNPLWKLQAETLKGSILQKMASTGSQWALAASRNQETAAWLKDALPVSKWNSLTPEERKVTVAPITESKTGAGNLQKTTAQDERYFAQKDANEIKKQHEANNTIAGKMIVKDHDDLLKRLGKIDKLTRIQIGQMKDPAQQEAALAFAEAAQEQAKQNVEKTAVLDAQVRGDQVATTFTDKGSSTKITSAKTGDTAPKETTVGGVTAIYNPKTGSFKIPTPPKSLSIPNKIAIQSHIGKLEKELIDSTSTNRIATIKSELKDWRSLLEVPTDKTASPAASSDTPHPESGDAPSKQLPKAETQADVDEAIRQANEAIKAGKDPAIIKKRLKDMGINLKE